MKIYISRAKGLAVEPILAQLKFIIEKANFKSVEYSWYQEGTQYSSKPLEEADMVIVISSDAYGLDTIGKGVYSEVKLAAEHDITVFTFTPCSETGNHFLQYIDACSNLKLYDKKNWQEHGSIFIYHDTDYVNCLTQDEDISENVFNFFNQHYALNCFQGYGEAVSTESSNVREFQHGDIITVTSLTDINRFTIPDCGIKMGNKFTVDRYSPSDYSVAIDLPNGCTWWVSASLFETVKTEDIRPSQPTPSYSKVLEEINCDEDYLLLR
jgi:hypothetical protein